MQVEANSADRPGSDRAGRPPRPALFWGVALGIALLDVLTKEVARVRLVPEHVPHELLGDAVRLTLVYNQGAAFGLHVGPLSRWVFTALSAAALVVLWRMYVATAPGDRWRVLALGSVVGGALGNIINRLWSARGVVDFLDVGVGDHRWPTFNVADIGVSVGAFLLAWVLWGEDRRRETAAAGADFEPQPSDGPT